jgi:hypothetical protein
MDNTQTLYRQFNPGDRVTWMKRTIRGSMIGIETKDGTIESITDNFAVVKPPKKHAKRVRVHTSRLRHADERTELMEVLGGSTPSRKGKPDEGRIWLPATKGADHATPTD